MEVQIKHVPAMRVIALRSLLPTYRAQKELWAKLWSFARLNQLSCVGHCVTVYYKIIDDTNPMADVQVCIPIDDHVIVPEDEKIKVSTLPPIDRAATTIHQGSFDNIGPVYEALHEWIRAHDEKENGPDREVCLSADENDVTEVSYITEIQVPLT